MSNRKTYVTDYINRALNDNTLEAPDTSQLNGYGEPLEALHRAHSKGGPEVAQHAWESIIQKRPELAELLVKDQTAQSLFHLYHADDLDNLPPLTWLIEGEIPEGGLTVLFGPSGGGKSFVALDYALRIAQNAPVVYVAAEGKTGYADRKNAWRIHHNIGSGKLYFLFEAVSMLDEGEVQKFIETARQLSPKLVVIDTLARCMLGGDENSAKDMGLFIESCATIQQKLNAAVLIVHHSGKKSGSERGSSALRGAADSMIELSNDDEIIELISSKVKDSGLLDSRYLRRITIETGENRSSCVLVPSARVVDVDGNALTPKQQLILETLNLETFVDSGAKAAVLKQTTGLPESTLYKVLSKMMKAKYVRQAKKGDPYFITEAGKGLLQSDS